MIFNDDEIINEFYDNADKFISNQTRYQQGYNNGYKEGFENGFSAGKEYWLNYNNSVVESRKKKNEK